MTPEKRDRLERDGWRVGSTAEFLGTERRPEGPLWPLAIVTLLVVLTLICLVDDPATTLRLLIVGR